MTGITLSGVAIAAMLVVACGSVDAGRDQRDIELHVSADTDSLAIGQLGRRQQQLLRTFVDTVADPTPYMSRTFRVVDQQDSTALSLRGFDGRPVPEAQLFRTLNRRLPDPYAHIVSMEARMMRPGSAVTFIRHTDGARSITYWQRSGDAWKATMMVINIDEPEFARAMRSHAES
jgi:hypothetical protein